MAPLNVESSGFKKSVSRFGRSLKTPRTLSVRTQTCWSAPEMFTFVSSSGDELPRWSWRVAPRRRHGDHAVCTIRDFAPGRRSQPDPRPCAALPEGWKPIPQASRLADRRAEGRAVEPLAHAKDGHLALLGIRLSVSTRRRSAEEQFAAVSEGHKLAHGAVRAVFGLKAFHHHFASRRQSGLGEAQTK